jgi:hypothetical protein
MELASKKVAWFGVVLALYFLYFASFYLATGFQSFFTVDWRAFQRLAVLVAPVYVWLLWRQRDHMIWLDYHAFYLPFVSWALAFWGVGGSKGLMNALVVEPGAVILLCGVYLLRFPLSAALPNTSAVKVGGLLLAVVVVCTGLVAMLVPPLPD